MDENPQKINTGKYRERNARSRARVMEMERYVLSILVQNEPGVLTRISRLFGARGYNIESLTVGRTHEPEISRVTVALTCDTQTLEQILKQTEKLYVVIAVLELKPKESVFRELALIKIQGDDKSRSVIREVADIFRANIVDVSPESLIVEITGDSEKIDAFLRLIQPYGILEMTRTGLTALGRGEQKIRGDR